jgi:hypothetical protein
MARRFWSARLIVNLILVALLETIGIFFVYYMGYLPLKAHGHEELNYILHHLDLRSPIWWRVFLTFLFDNLLLFIGAIGLYWGLGTFAVYAWEEGKWRKYYSSPEAKREPWIEKFTLWQRIQHVWVFSTFIVCAYTGIVMYLGNNPYWHFLYFASREDFVRAHVIAGWLMGAIMIFHFGYYGSMILLDMLRSNPVYGDSMPPSRGSARLPSQRQRPAKSHSQHDTLGSRPAAPPQARQVLAPRVHIRQDYPRAVPQGCLVRRRQLQEVSWREYCAVPLRGRL